MGSKRDKLQVIYDILRAIQMKNNLIKRTHILYKANLSHQMLDLYLNDLIERGLVVETVKKKNTRLYSLTDKGYAYLNKYKMVTNFMDLFGLE